MNQKTILEEAIELTSQIRISDYGHPKFHFACTAKLITTYLQRKGVLKEDEKIDPEDWPIFMILDKISRSAERWKRDNFVDIAGYARTREMLEENQNEDSELLNTICKCTCYVCCNFSTSPHLVKDCRHTPKEIKNENSGNETSSSRSPKE